MTSMDTSVDTALKMKTEDPKPVAQESGTPGSYPTTPRSGSGVSDEFSKEEVGKWLQLRILVNERRGARR